MATGTSNPGPDCPVVSVPVVAVERRVVVAGSGDLAAVEDCVDVAVVLTAEARVVVADPGEFVVDDCIDVAVVLAAAYASGWNRFVSFVIARTIRGAA